MVAGYAGQVDLPVVCTAAWKMLASVCGGYEDDQKETLSSSKQGIQSVIDDE